MRITEYRLDVPNVMVKVASRNYMDEAELSNPNAVVKMMNAVFGLDRRAEEYIYVLAMNMKMRPMGVFEVSHGTINSSLCSPREVFMRALLCGASGIILCHNHPSGDAAPSKADNEVTKKISQAGKLMDVNLKDHIIIGNGSYFSFFESCPEYFS